MGLLEKATLHKVSSSPETGSGLLSKAQKFQEEKSTTTPKLQPEDTKPKSLLGKAEKLLEEEKNLLLETIPEVPDSLDVFDTWEEEAKEASRKAPVLSQTKESPLSGEEYLFDDESDFTTAPIEYHLASKRKIENYHAVFEITKELIASSNFESFFSNLNYSIAGHIGVDTFAIFSSTEDSFQTLYLMEYQGFEPEGEWCFRDSDETLRKLGKSESVIYAGELYSMNIPLRERELLEKMGAEILAPLRESGNFYGFIVLGKLLNGEEYIADDLEFIKVIADISGSVFQRIKDSQSKIRELEEIKNELEMSRSVLDFAGNVAEVRKLDDLYDLFLDVMKNQFGIERFTFMIVDTKTKDEYKIFSSNQISLDAAEGFSLGRNSNIVGMVSNVSGIYELSDFRTNPEILSLLPNDEIGIMEEFIVIPIINLNWLVGMFIIHRRKAIWSESEKKAILRLVEIASPVFANLLLMGERENVFSNPFSPLEDRLKFEIRKADSLANPFTVAVFKVQNVSRMIQILGEQAFAKYCDDLRKSIQSYVGENDHYIRAGRGKFVAIFHAKDKGEAEIVIRKIKGDFKPDSLLEKSRFRPSYRILTLSYPEDTKEISAFLEMVEEA